MNRRKPVIIAHHISYINPLDCGSTVGYRIRRGGLGRIDGEVDLTDCNRKIEWYFGENRQATLHKIDEAITILVRFRTEYLAALENVHKKKRKKYER